MSTPRSPDPCPECRQRIESERIAAIRSSISVLIHEVVNKLNNLSVQAQMLDRALRREDHPLSHRSHRLRLDVQALSELLEGFERADRTGASRSSAVDLSDVVHQVREAELEAAVPGGVTVVEHTAANVSPVRGDRGDVCRIVSYLLRNALEAMPDGGRLTIRIQGDDGHVKLLIEDTGLGISPNVDVFRPFQTSKRQHLGLGLSFVRHLVKAQGGSVRFESEIGKGTRFIVRFPAVGESERW